MIEKKIDYIDLDGKPAVGHYHFQLSEAELAEMKLSHKGDIAKYFRDIIASEDGEKVIHHFREIIFKAVGVRQGLRLVKSDDVRDEFAQTGAYDSLFMELIQSKDSGASFFVGMLPASMQAQIAAGEGQDTQHTDEQLLHMSDAEFAAVAGTNALSMSKRHLAIAMQRKTAA